MESLRLFVLGKQKGTSIIIFVYKPELRIDINPIVLHTLCIIESKQNRKRFSEKPIVAYTNSAVGPIHNRLVYMYINIYI